MFTEPFLIATLPVLRMLAVLLTCIGLPEIDTRSISIQILIMYNTGMDEYRMLKEETEAGTEHRYRNLYRHSNSTIPQFYLKQHCDVIDSEVFSEI